MIYDCFIFSHELDLLDIRLHELSSVVDRFVLVEATETFSGKPKPLYFDRHKDRYRQFLSKIIHVIVNDLSDAKDATQLPYFTGHPFQRQNILPWSREIFQRNAIMRGLNSCKKGDIILVSDADEIPRRATVAKLSKIRGVLTFTQANYCYYFNCRAQEDWQGTRAVSYSRDLIPEVVRNTQDHCIPRAGWHFSYLGEPAKIIQKISAYSHQEHNTPFNLDPSRIKHNIDNALDLFERPFSYRFVPLDNSFPSYLRTNQDQFSSFIHPIPLLNQNETWLRQEVERLRTELYWKKLELDQTVTELNNYQTKYRQAIRYNPLHYLVNKLKKNNHA